MSKFIYCPDCGRDNLKHTDYEDEEGHVDDDGRRCDVCGWEGDVTELVCDDLPF